MPTPRPIRRSSLRPRSPREAIQGLLGEDLSPVEEDFERSRLTGSDRHPPQLFVVIVQQILRQTGGSGEIPSGGAVLDPHHWLLSRRRLAGPSLAMPRLLRLPTSWVAGPISQESHHRECRMEGSPARPRLMQPVARRVPREAGRLHPEMSGHAGDRGAALPRARPMETDPLRSDADPPSGAPRCGGRGTDRGVA